LPCTQEDRERYPTGPLMTELEFEQAVEAWHASASNLPVHEFIGLTWEQYASLVEDRVYAGALEFAMNHSELLAELAKT
jgi:hypothetical protein